MPDLARLSIDADIATLTLDRPGRGNALVPELLDSMRDCLARAARADVHALVLNAKGRAFSAGGDVAGFAERGADTDALLAYSADIVGGLNRTILNLLVFPAPVVAAVNGAVTGGSAGFLLASDIVVMSERAFLQPYYSDMGFAPDGGWTALLPERIGAAKALEVQYLNTRLDARTCRELGLASRICASEDLETEVAALVQVIAAKDRESLKASRANTWSPLRRGRVAAALERERAAFLRLIARPETAARMSAFLAPAASVGKGG
ncbi:enoyl-CoA hydratase/isomerase family protein [Stappia sp. ES.058]|uniref:enoyl-CoA hydratase/isomerase family protein n=1 Tax=Stappia sp. ES.058 TaxID=1881061 RepID=UPI000879656F|nr:enoyl-CoA hydratase/isomerase family protein [Stappia sp. ES.058]SDT89675.1 2-(1,2-epoxy-1,2-dihydrophenyl)acetyl-CoA isomerase [Stappia sp. ES.058]